jgi:hypothetical protein
MHDRPAGGGIVASGDLWCIDWEAATAVMAHEPIQFSGPLTLNTFLSS